MHDFSISRQIAREVIKKASEKGALEVLEVKIKIGELTHLNPEQLKFWLKELFRDTLAKGAKIKIEKMPLIIRCISCGFEGKVETKEEFCYFSFFPSVVCPSCHSTEIEVKSGEECILERMRIKI